MRNSVYSVSQFLNTKPILCFKLIFLFLLTPNKVDYVTPANYIFFIFLFFIHRPIKASCLLPHFAFSKWRCPLHEVSNTKFVCVTWIVFVSHYNTIKVSLIHIMWKYIANSKAFCKINIIINNINKNINSYQNSVSQLYFGMEVGKMNEYKEKFPFIWIFWEIIYVVGSWKL